jgi:cytochrome c-type biogenesis protein CcmH
MMGTKDFRRMLALGLLALSVIGVASVITASSAGAQEPSPEIQNKMEQIAKDLYCPVCVPLNVCETQACEQWRQLIIEKLQAGQTEAQIRQYFIDQYGDRVLGAPPAQGFSIGAYLLPILILIAGLAVILFTLRGWLRGRAAAEPSSPVTVPSIPSEYAERIARELKETE